jgi:hypothetical protein
MRISNITELPIETCHFELRYEHAFLVWDNFGSIWTAVLARNPALRLTMVQATHQIFETESLQLSVDHSVLRVSSRGPDAIEVAVKNAAALTKIFSDRAKVSSYTRVGFREIRTKFFESRREAAKFAKVGETNDNNVLGDDADQKASVINHRFETGKAGIQGTLRFEEREWNFTIPWEARSHIEMPVVKKKWVLTADTDYYTVGIVPQDSFDVATWVTQASRMVQRYWDEGNHD